MGSKKPQKKSKSRARERDADEGPGILASILSWTGRGFTVIAVLALIAGGVGWVLGANALQARAAQITAQPVTVRFNWPTTPSGGTWVPRAVRLELSRIVESSLSTDPFDRASIQNLYDQLNATGWFREIRALSRKPGGVVRVEAEWRTPAAVVVRSGCRYLIGTDSAVMQLPARFALDPALFRIENPTADPERDPATGDVRYGAAWPLDDVDHALRLLAAIARLPEGSSVVAVDLAEYPRSGRLLVKTSTGCVLNWGAPIDEAAPGEATVDRKVANLRTILTPNHRLDRGVARIDINRGHVVADTSGRNDAPIE